MALSINCTVDKFFIKFNDYRSLNKHFSQNIETIFISNSFYWIVELFVLRLKLRFCLKDKKS